MSLNLQEATQIITQSALQKEIYDQAEVEKYRDEIVSKIPAATRSSYDENAWIAAAEYLPTYEEAMGVAGPKVDGEAPVAKKGNKSELPPVTMPTAVAKAIEATLRKSEATRKANQKSARIVKLLFRNPSPAGLVSTEVVPTVKDIDAFKNYEKILVADEDGTNVATYNKIKNAIENGTTLPVIPGKAASTVIGVIANVIVDGEGTSQLSDKVFKTDHLIGWAMENTFMGINTDDNHKLGFKVLQGKVKSNSAVENNESVRYVPKFYGKKEALAEEHLHEFIMEAAMKDGAVERNDNMKLTVGSFKIYVVDDNGNKILKADGTPKTRTVRVTGTGFGPKWIRKDAFVYEFGANKVKGGPQNVVSAEDEAKAMKNLKELLARAVLGQVEADNYGVDFARTIEAIKDSSEDASTSVAADF